MPTGTYTPDVAEQFFDNNGKPVAAGKLFTYAAGTTTAQATYSDVNLTVPNGIPPAGLVLDSSGRPQSGAIFLVPGQSYKFVLQDSLGNVIWTRDNISAVPTTSGNLDVIGTAGQTLTAGLAVYLSDGSGAKTAGQWYLADNTNDYSSITVDVGIVPATITSAGTGTVRKGGSVAGLTLTQGSNYYIGTAGALTATSPSVNRRRLGQADTTSSLVLEIDTPPILINNGLCEGRLTLTTGTPVTSADVTAATTLYFTPYGGNRIALYDGAVWTVRAFAELSIAVPATTATMYDVWVYDNAGVTTLELLAWTNDTTRATALVLQDGVLCKTGALTRRYVGSFRTTGSSGQTEDSVLKRYVWNYYNRVARQLQRFETTATWTYTTATYRQANGATANQVEIVVGVAEALVRLFLQALVHNDTGGTGGAVSIGEDSTTAAATTVLSGGLIFIQNASQPINATLEKYPAVGRHYYAWLEQSAASGTTTWYGQGNVGGGATTTQGLFGWIEG